MATGSPRLPRMQFASHCVSCGQTRPVTAGSALSESRLSAAALMFPSARKLMKRGMLTITGQPCTQCAFLHLRQRCASSIANCSGRPRLTSSKLPLRRRASCSGIF